MADERAEDQGPEGPVDENIFVEDAPNGAQGDAPHVRGEDAPQDTVEHKVEEGPELYLFARDSPNWMYTQSSTMTERTTEILELNFGQDANFQQFTQILGPTRVTTEGTLFGTITVRMRTTDADTIRAVMDQLEQAGLAWLGAGWPEGTCQMTRKWPMAITPLPAIKEILDIIHRRSD